MTKPRWLLAGVVCLALWPAPAPAQGNLWETYNDAGVKAYLDGDHAEARTQFAAALREARRFGTDDPRLAQSLSGMAEVQRAEGKLDDAERLHEEALTIREKAFGPRHPEVAQSLENLATVYRAQGRIASAEAFERQASIIRYNNATAEEAWQMDMTAADSAYQQGDYAEAERLLNVAVERAEGFGSQDQRLALSLNNLAEVYRKLALYDEAEALHRQVLEILEEALGPESPHVGTSLFNLASLYQIRGKYDQAEPLYRRSLAILDAALGPDHPAVAESLASYAKLLRKTGRDAEAEQMEARASAIRAKQPEVTP
jgi:tetratricopeptide (TPR) repeat protein